MTIRASGWQIMEMIGRISVEMAPGTTDGTRITETTWPEAATTGKLRLEAGHDCYGH